MPSELFGTSVIFVKVAPGYVERTLTTLRAKPNVTKAEAVFGRHDIAIAGGFRNTDELRAFASEVQAWDHVRGFRSYPALQDWTQKKADGHASNAYLVIRSSIALLRYSGTRSRISCVHTRSPYRRAFNGRRSRQPYLRRRHAEGR